MSDGADRELAAPRTVAETVAVHARRQPAAPAILAPGRPALDYGALAELIERAVHTLADAGLGRGKRLAVALPNGPEMAAALLAVMSCATCAPLNASTDEDAAHDLLTVLHADAVVVAANETSAIRRVAESLGLQIVEIAPLRDVGSVLVVNVERRANAVLAEAPQPADIALLMTTSGTTGLPKVVPLSHDDLNAAMERQVAAFGFSHVDRCLCVAPLFTTSGIRRNLLGMVAVGGSVVCIREFHAVEFIGWLREFRPTYYAAGPAIHRALLETHAKGGAIGPNSLRFILSGATSLPQGVEERLERMFGVPVIQALGMSEAGLVASNPLPPGIRRPGSVGRPAGLDVAIHDDAGRALPALEAGEVVIRGQGVIRRYEDNPDANRDAFRDGWFRTGDLGYFDEDGYLYLTGRVKELINRGGFKVSPYEIDAVLLDHPDVAEAATFAVAHPTLGEDVNTAIVARSASARARELRDFALARLPHYKVPSQILLVPALPKNALGKLNRQEVARRLTPSLREQFTPPRNATEAHVARVFGAVLGLPDVGAFDNFFHLGGDSLRGARVAAQINAERATDVTAALLFRRPTVAEFASELDAAPGSDTKPALRSIPRVGRVGRSATSKSKWSSES